MTFPNNSIITASGWNKQNIYLSNEDVTTNENIPEEGQYEGQLHENEDMTMKNTQRP